MPFPPATYLSTGAPVDWAQVRALWLDYVQGRRPDLANLDAVAAAADVAPATLAKKTGRWKAEEAAKLAQAKQTLDAQAQALAGPRGPKGRKARARQATQDQGASGSRTQDRLNAAAPPRSSLSYLDQLRQGRALAKESLGLALEALIDEVKHGEGSSRVTAIKELTALAGLVKDTEKQDEPSPYETEERHVLEERLTELLGSLPMFTSLLKSMAGRGAGVPETNPTTSEGAPAPDPITPLPSGAHEQVAVPAGAGLEVGDDAGLVHEPVAAVAPMKVMLT